MEKQTESCLGVDPCYKYFKLSKGKCYVSIIRNYKTIFGTIFIEFRLKKFFGKSFWIIKDIRKMSMGKNFKLVGTYTPKQKNLGKTGS